MGAIRVQAFQEGGSMLFPGMLDQQVQPPPAQQPPVTQLGNSPLPQPPPAPAINTQPPVTEMPTDDNIELDKARREDESVLGTMLSTTGDHRFLSPRPQQPTEETIAADPDWAKLQQGKQVIDDYVRQNPGAKRTEITAGIAFLRGKEKELRKRYSDTYKNDFNAWKMNEVQQLKERGDHIPSGTALEGQNALAKEFFTQAQTKAKAHPEAEVATAADASTYMSPASYQSTLINIGTLNKKPLERAQELLTHLAAPNGAFNGRKGIAAANYKIAGSDVLDNVWLDTRAGKIRVTPDDLRQLEESRHKAYKALQQIEKRRAATPPTRTAGQWAVDQFK